MDHRRGEEADSQASSAGAHHDLAQRNVQARETRALQKVRDEDVLTDCTALSSSMGRRVVPSACKQRFTVARGFGRASASRIIPEKKNGTILNKTSCLSQIVAFNAKIWLTSVLVRYRSHPRPVLPDTALKVGLRIAPRT